MMSVGKYVHGGKGQNRAIQSRKNFAQKQQILLGVSKYPRLQSSLSSLSACNQVEEVPTHGWAWESLWAELEEEVIFNLSLIDV